MIVFKDKCVTHLTKGRPTKVWPTWLGQPTATIL